MTLITQKIMTSEDKWCEKKREAGFYEKLHCFQSHLFLKSLKTESLLCRKALDLLSVSMDIGALGNDCKAETISHIHAP